MPKVCNKSAIITKSVQKVWQNQQPVAHFAHSWALLQSLLHHAVRCRWRLQRRPFGTWLLLERSGGLQHLLESSGGWAHFVGTLAETGWTGFLFWELWCAAVPYRLLPILLISCLSRICWHCRRAVDFVQDRLLCKLKQCLSSLQVTLYAYILCRLFTHPVRKLKQCSPKHTFYLQHEYFMHTLECISIKF